MYFRRQLIEYVCKGHCCGAFMCALVSGDLYNAVKKADDGNKLQIVQLVEWIYNHAPVGSYGSPEKAHAWIEARGLEGKGGTDAVERWKVINDIDV